MRKILIVEDEPMEQKFLQDIIRKELADKVRVESCNNGKQAVVMAGDYRPDCIIADVLMPEMDGLSAVRRIKDFLPQVKVVMLSAYSEFSYAQTALRLRVEDYLLKPVKPEEICRLLRELLFPQELVNVEALHIPQNISQDQNDFIEQTLAYVQMNFKQKLTLPMIANYVFVNPQYLSRAFKKRVGITLVAYLNRLKIKYACELLAETTYPGYRISEECGFSDASYFYRLFFQHMKITPRQYRRQAYQRAREAKEMENFTFPPRK